MSMTPERAVDIVAADLLATLVDTYADDYWDAYPEVGEGDWVAVVDRAHALKNRPDLADFSAAYATLAGRAEH